MRPEGRRLLDQLYEASLARLPFDVEARDVQTRFGRARVLLAGPVAGPPVIAPHGMNAHGPATLEMLGGLVELGYRLIAPDLPGQAGHSEERVLPRGDDSYGQWIADVADGLGIERFALLGASQGAFVSLRTAAFAPERVTCLALVVPAGIVEGNVGWMLFGFLAPVMFWWRWLGRRDKLRGLVQQVFTESVSEDWVDLIGACVEHLPGEGLGRWRMAAPEQFEHLDAPVLVVAGEHDRFFPCDQVVARAREVFPGARIEILDGQNHFPSPEGLARILDLFEELVQSRPKPSASPP